MQPGRLWPTTAVIWRAGAAQRVGWSNCSLSEDECPRPLAALHAIRSGRSLVGPYPDTTGGSGRYAVSSGVSDSRTAMSDQASVAAMLVAFQKAVMSDGINPRKAQAAFLAIDEYRRMVGAENAAPS